MKNREIVLDEVAVMYSPLKPYVEKVIPLMLKHTWILKNKLDSDTEYQLRQSLWIGRLITLDSRIVQIETENEIEGWPQLRAKIIQQINNCTSSENLGKMTNNVLNLIGPILSKNYIDKYRIPKRQFNSWWYTIHRQKTLVAVHLINSYQPESPFTHQKSFANDLLRAIKHAKTANSEITTVECGSWLNQYPKFQQLWPKSFIENQKIINKAGGAGPGAWGQYMGADGSFLEKNATYLLKYDEHPYSLTQAQVPIDELIIYLENYISKLQP